MHEITQFTPLGWIYVLRGVPWDNTYRNTRWFDSQGEQQQYFIGKRVYTFDHTTPVRPGVPLRLPVNMSRIYDCDYIMFQNTNYSEKWFYAFITDIRWVSINSCEVDYDLDMVQTWLFQYQIEQCFVVREHSSTDMPGDNLIAENLELGEYMYSGMQGTGMFEHYVYLAAATVDKEGNDAVGGLYSGIYSGLEYNIFTDATSLNEYIDAMVSDSKGDAIVSISMYPLHFIDEKGSEQADVDSFKVDKGNGYSQTIDGYSPRNKKLLTHPFNFLFCTNLAGMAAEFPYEYFTTPDCEFLIFCDMSPQPTATLVPVSYKGAAQNFNEKLTMDGFPMCPWATDTYKAWLAQNGSSTAITTMGGAFSTLGNLFSGNIGGAVNGALSIAQTVAKVKATQALPPQAHGAAGNTAMVAIGKKDFYFYRCTITAQYAKIIDDYFQMFGYATNRVKRPNFHTRLGWNYVETRDAVVLGTAPQNACSKMESILNTGITFWHDDLIGTYNRNNGIVSTSTQGGEADGEKEA